MRWSQALIPTLKETPADAVAPSHVFLLRAGMIRQLGAGAYTYLPLGLRVLQKAVKIVREEMDAAGALEMLMPALHPVEIWRESGRDRTMKGILMEVKLGDKEFVLGPTHEEPVTDIVRDLVKSYKQLPFTVYQIQTKFRNEPRPRFGILRTREFLMKDAYSFSANVEQLSAAYDAMYEAYCRIFDRCGFPYVAVEAESGPIGGDSSHEFMVPCASGEDVILYCQESGYAANVEKAEVGAISWPAPTNPDAPPHQPVKTPYKKTIDDVCKFLKVPKDTSAKLLVFLADEKPVAVLIRGDHEANESKVRRAFGATTLEQATPEAIQQATGAPMGFLGPVGLTIPLAIDQSVAAMPNVVVGGNEVDIHFTGVVPGRDFPLDRVLDLRNAVEGDPCPRSGKPMTMTTGIEIGHVFKLGTKYSDAMGAKYLDENGESHSVIMGCYGIGINRILASAVEAGHDANGIIWPLNLAPYEVLLVPLQLPNEAVEAKTHQIAAELEAAGVDVLIDDRDHRPGFKFKDADLIGIPVRVVIGERGLKEGNIEVKWRADSSAHTVPAEDAASAILGELTMKKGEQESLAAERRASRLAAKGKTA